MATRQELDGSVDEGVHSAHAPSDWDKAHQGTDWFHLWASHSILYVHTQNQLPHLDTGGTEREWSWWGEETG